ncbi:MAG: phosphoenolpyruvate carboxykinase domain-containing protein [Deltaproteobacteria bacterium]|nr:phosphoenolpyruvate carboxykinase domain-containing protein [Deltaproteobacteria bacterium]
MLVQARQLGDTEWNDVIAAHLGARSQRVIRDGDDRALLDLLRREGTLIPLHATKYPDCDLVRAPAELAQDVDPTRFVTSSGSSAEVSELHRWMSTAWVEKRFWRNLQGSARGRELFVLPLHLSALGRSFDAVVATDIPALAASLVRMVPGTHERGARPPSVRVLAMMEASARDRFICLSPQDGAMWTCGWPTGPARCIEEALGVAFPNAMRDQLRDVWAAPSTLTRLSHPKSKAQRTLAFIGGAWKQRLAAAWTSEPDGPDASLISDGPTWFQRTNHGVIAESPFKATRLPLRALHLPAAASVITSLHSELLFANAAATTDGLAWWDERGDPPASEMLDWTGFPKRAGSGRLAHPNASVVIPHRKLRRGGAVEATTPIAAMVFVVSVHTAMGTLLEAASWEETIAVALGLDALDGRMHDPLGLRSFAGPVVDGLQAWLDVGAAGSAPPRAFVWAVPRFGPQTPAGEVSARIFAALDGHGVPARSALGSVWAATMGGPSSAVAVVDAIGGVLDALGSRCPPSLRRAHHKLARRALDEC